MTSGQIDGIMGTLKRKCSTPPGPPRYRVRSNEGSKASSFVSESPGSPGSRRASKMSRRSGGSPLKELLEHHPVLRTHRSPVMTRKKHHEGMALREHFDNIPSEDDDEYLHHFSHFAKKIRSFEDAKKQEDQFRSDSLSHPFCAHRHQT